MAYPIFGAGGYPGVMQTVINSNSIREGRSWSRLPTLSQKWKEMIRGSADFFGLNYYTSRYVVLANEPHGPNPSWERDNGLTQHVKPEWKQARSKWLYSVPQGLGDILRWIKEEYNNPEVFITENGWSDDGELHDIGRVEYLRGHLNELLSVVTNNECDVKGYAVWSIIDNFEWLAGYT